VWQGAFRAARKIGVSRQVHFLPAEEPRYDSSMNLSKHNLPRHMPALDGLRGIAILMVILTHVVGGTGLENAAGHGVALFFVVSAFTLTVRSARDRSGLRSYALRRIARVGPGYWIAGLAYTLALGLAPNGITPTDLLIAAVFGSAWQGGASLEVVPGGWSVSCEVAFYIALPLLIWAINGRIWRAVILTGLAMAVAQFRARHAILAGTYGFSFYVNPIEQAPVFLCGVTAALVAMRVRLPRMAGVAVGLLVPAFAILPLLRIPGWYVQHQIAFAGLASVVVALSAMHPRGLLASHAMRRIGEVSYSMYLVHFAVLPVSLRLAEWMSPPLDRRTLLLHFAFTLAATFTIAQITYRVIEQPPIRWAARRSRSPTVPSPAAAQLTDASPTGFAAAGSLCVSNLARLRGFARLKGDFRMVGVR
jgi:peptidoglycan/LPS O-acetylase OafA/YrhL